MEVQLACCKLLAREGRSPGLTRGSVEKERLLIKSISTGALTGSLSETRPN